MTITRCLRKYVHPILLRPDREWRGMLDLIPDECPHDDCSKRARDAGCKKMCEEYAADLWKCAREIQKLKDKQDGLF
jgi:hypothetical protein